jgi:hypothetical protein
MPTLADRPPQLTVVVPSVNGESDLRDCLGALEVQREDVSLDVIVINRCGASVGAMVARAFPQTRVIDVTTATTIPAMRARAFAAASAPAIAVIEDHVIVPAGWARRLLDAQAEGGETAVIGGSVHNAATERVVDWAAFLCEYSHCLQPLPSGPSDWLTGNNTVYPRALLERYRDVLNAGHWENYLHDAMRRDGVSLIMRPDIGVGHKKHYSVREYASQRYLYARSYAGARLADASLIARAAYGAAALALPPLLWYRVVSRVVVKRRHRAELARSLPLLAIFVMAWAVGEVVGAWLGPGDALERVC